MAGRWLLALSTAAMLAAFAQRPASADEPFGYLLGLPPGGRAIGMGMAQGAVAEDPDAGYWNPAALAFIDPDHGASFTYSRLKGAFDLTFPFVFAAYSEQVEAIHGAIAASFSYFDLGERQAAGESFRHYEVAPQVALGTRVTNDFAVGMGVKLYRVNYSVPSDPPEADATANTVLFDGGVLWRGMESRLFIGGSVQNLGPGLELGSPSQSYPVSRNLKLATGAHLVDMESARLTVACDVDIPLAGEDNSPFLRVGGEMHVGEYAAMRIGLRYDGWVLADDAFAQDQQKYATTVGFGVRVNWLAVDYANAPWDVLTPMNSHHITIAARF